ncbi:uncharacterized protein Dsimw501_GD27755 [Drosophila simulans]|uniref:Uncharacterized protein n=1 Tax=Drosophila simulans TaxID=7240 RepID=A0A0J9R7U3_DROSI|nr:uncharacterized protein Dsimw501_GD27755 [Drosophila simulans]
MRLHSDYSYFIFTCVRSKQALLIAYSHRFNVAPPLTCRAMQLNCSRTITHLNYPYEALETYERRTDLSTFD